jgi:predicted nuclease of predicted toxin-antitoxin system
MRVLLDNCVNLRLKEYFSLTNVVHVRELGWQDLTNGKLLKAAEDEGFSILITVDKNMRHQQNLKNFTVNLVTNRYSFDSTCGFDSNIAES